LPEKPHGICVICCKTLRVISVKTPGVTRRL
jgi:hypothetical protein